MKRSWIGAWALLAACKPDEEKIVEPKATEAERSADARQETAAQAQADATADAKIGREELAISVGLPSVSDDLQAYGRAEYDPGCAGCHGAYAEGASVDRPDDAGGPINVPGLRAAAQRMTEADLAAAMAPEAHSALWRADVPALDLGRRLRVAGYLKAVWGRPEAAPPAGL